MTTIKYLGSAKVLGPYEKDCDSVNEENLSSEIAKLGKKSHESIYQLLRQYKPQKFFTTTETSTFFDYSKLEKHVIEDLIRMVELCKDDEKRVQVIEKATFLHDSKMNA